MSANAVVRARIDEHIKEEAKVVVAAIFSASTGLIAAWACGTRKCMAPFIEITLPPLISKRFAYVRYRPRQPSTSLEAAKLYEEI